MRHTLAAIILMAIAAPALAQMSPLGLWRSVDGGDWTLVTADFAAPPRKPLYLPIILR